MTTSEIPAPVQAVVDAINDADTNAFLAAFAEEGHVDDGGRVFEGIDNVHRWALSDVIGERARLTVVGATAEGEATSLTMDWSSDSFTGQVRALVAVHDGKVTSLRIAPHS